MTPILDAISSRSQQSSPVHEVTREEKPIATPSSKADQKFSSKKQKKDTYFSVLLKGLPDDADYTFVASLVHGGNLAAIDLLPQESSAIVSFTRTIDAYKYANAHVDAIEGVVNGESFQVIVTPRFEHKALDRETGICVEFNATRVIRLSDHDLTANTEVLYDLARISSTVGDVQDKRDRKLEAVWDIYRESGRKTYFRFANIVDSADFRRVIRSLKEWEDATAEFVLDPCNVAKEPLRYEW